MLETYEMFFLSVCVHLLMLSDVYHGPQSRSKRTAPPYMKNWINTGV